GVFLYMRQVDPEEDFGRKLEGYASEDAQARARAGKPRFHHGAMDARTYGIVVSRFNSLVTRELLNGAHDCLLRHGAQEKDITVAWVPGAGEIPQALR